VRNRLKGGVGEWLVTRGDKGGLPLPTLYDTGVFLPQSSKSLFEVEVGASAAGHSLIRSSRLENDYSAVGSSLKKAIPS
jgi:hypothetical protein